MTKKVERLKAETTGFNEFLNGLKLMCSIGNVTKSEAVKLLSNVNTGFDVIDDSLKSLRVDKTRQGYLTFNNHYPGEIRKIIREGDLRGIVKVSKKRFVITDKLENEFKRLTPQTPEKSLRKMFDKVEFYKKTKSYIDSTIDNIKYISMRGMIDLAIIEKNLRYYCNKGEKIPLTLGVVNVEVGWIKKATEMRKGCFMLRTVNNKTSSCKIDAHSCNKTSGYMCQNLKPFYNVTLTLMHIVTLEDTDVTKILIANTTGIRVSDLYKKLASVIDNHYENVATIIQNMEQLPIIPNICKLTHPDIESKKVLPCRLCNPSADPLSTTYIDSNQYEDDITFHCSANPSILETIVDVAMSIDKNLFLDTNSYYSLKSIFISITIVLILVLMIFIAFKFGPKILSHMPNYIKSYVGIGHNQKS